MARPAPANPELKGEVIEIIAASQPASAPQPGDISKRLSDLSGIRCVLFDIYGTLFTSASGDVGTAESSSADDNFALALRRAGFELRGPEVAAEAGQRYFREIGRRHSNDRARGIDYPEVDIVDVWNVLISGLMDDGLAARPVQNTGNQDAVRAAVWYEVLSNPVAPMPFARSTLDRISSSGLLLGIVSNAQFYTPLLFPALMKAESGQLGFRDDLCSWSFRIGRAKPSVEVFTPVLDRLADADSISPHNVLYVGNDMLNDVWTAHEAGCRTALFGGDSRSLRLRSDDPRCAALHADIVVVELPDLLQALGIAPDDGAEGNTE